jgi:hypothetical protein
MVIQMYFNDHAPPHFHVRYADFKATVGIADLVILTGELPSTAQRLVMDWAREHQQELLEDWNLCQEKKQPFEIAPLP